MTHLEIIPKKLPESHSGPDIGFRCLPVHRKQSSLTNVFWR